MLAGGWPIAMDDEEWDSNEYTWQRVDGHYVFLTGRHAFYKIQTENSFRDGDERIEVSNKS